MPHKPQVGIIIPAYNVERYVSATLDSVIGQTYSDWECVLVNDGSSDGTQRVLEEYAQCDSRIHVFEQQNAGVSAARNYGLEKLDKSVPYVIFLDADDIWEPDALETLVRTLEAKPEAVAVHGIASFINSDGKPILEGQLEDWARHRLRLEGKRVTNCDATQPTTFEMLAIASCLPPPGTVLIRRAILEKTGLFKEGLKFGEDWDLWIRLSRHSDIPLIDKKVLRYRQHDTNSSSNRKVAMHDGAVVRKRIINSPANTREQRRVALIAYRAFYWSLAQRRIKGGFDYLRKGQFKRGGLDLLLSGANFFMGLRGRP